MVKINNIRDDSLEKEGGKKLSFYLKITDLRIKIYSHQNVQD